MHYGMDFYVGFLAATDAQSYIYTGCIKKTEQI
jgi:hypothetical protein